jgi:uncharacterized phage protein (TIGR01671 family)
MNREINIRGKSVEDGAWCKGFLYIDHRNGKHWIITSKNTNADMHMDEVIPETVGEYSGLKDKIGKEIYEGDVVNYPFKNFNGEIIFKDGGFCIEKNSVCRYDLDRSATLSVVVLGNIYENQELLNTKQ